MMTEHEQTLADLDKIAKRYAIREAIWRTHILEATRMWQRYRVACQYLVIACGLLLAIAVCGWIR